MSDNAASAGAPISLLLTDPMIFPLVPATARAPVKLLWSLINRLAEMAVSGKEPALRQIRLRWWADQLALTENGTVPHEPLIAEVAATLVPLLGAAPLAGLAEAWIDAAAPDPDMPPAHDHGARLFALTASVLGAGQSSALAEAGRLWAAVTSLLEQEGDNAGAWHELAMRARTLSLASLPRPLATLAALSRSVARRHGVRHWRREQLLVLRVGLFGR